MIVGIDPFDAPDPISIYNNIMVLNFKFTRGFPSKAKSLVKKLLVLNPRQRLGDMHLGAADVKNHEWFSNLNFDQVENQEITPNFLPKSELRNLKLNKFYKLERRNIPEISDDFNPFINW